MQTDPILHYPYAASNHAELIRHADRERASTSLHPWHRPLTVSMAAARTSFGGKIVHLGQRLQGAAKIPAPATR